MDTTWGGGREGDAEHHTGNAVTMVRRTHIQRTRAHIHTLKTFFASETGVSSQ